MTDMPNRGYPGALEMLANLLASTLREIEASRCPQTELSSRLVSLLGQKIEDLEKLGESGRRRYWDHGAVQHGKGFVVTLNRYLEQLEKR